MFRRFSANFALFSMLLDALMIGLTLYVSAYLRVDITLSPIVKSVTSPVVLPVIIYVIFPLLWVGILAVFMVYDGRKNLKFTDELSSLTMGSILATISMAGVLFLTFRTISRFLFVFFAVEAYMMLVLWRVVLRLAWRWKFLPQMDVRRVLVVGAGEVGLRMRDQVLEQPGFGLKFTGFLDDDSAKLTTVDHVLGSVDLARQVVTTAGIDDVIIALPRSAHDRLSRVVSELHDLPVRVWVIPDYFSLALHRATVEEFAGIPMLDLRAPALTEYQRMLKRAFDLIVSLMALPFVLALTAMIGIAIKLDSPGPVFYRSKRLGENGRLFDMIKFRTMVVDADKVGFLNPILDLQGQTIYKHPKDPRITRVGAVLRRISLDEIPQTFNVLVGEMSLVGPRPELPRFVDRYEPWQRKRFAVPQGMTGWWQVNGRSDKPMYLHTDEDLYYVQHYSIWLDIKILLRTLWVVIRGKGAY